MADHYGTNLAVGVGWLKAFDPLATDAQKGITQADLTAAENWADAVVEAAFIGLYDMADWKTTQVPLVAQIFDLLASARAIAFKYARPAMADNEKNSQSDVLMKQALELIQQVRGEREPRLVLTRSSALLPRLSGRDAWPVLTVPDTTFFPANDDDTSHGIATSFNLQTLYEEYSV